MNRLHVFLEDLSLRKTLAIALLVGLAVPVSAAAWLHVTEWRAELLERLNNDHTRIVEVLASGMQTPLWEIRPDAGKPLLEALMLDKRVTAITVSSPLTAQFLKLEVPQRRQGEILSLSSSVMYHGEKIGQVKVDMDTGQLEAQLASQWDQILMTGLVQLVTGLLIIFALLRLKVLEPLRSLIAQSEALAAGTLDQPLNWRRGDELGVLGRSFEQMRRALRNLIADLEQRNEILREREETLASQASVLRAILDNMTDGITLVDENLHLITWNNQFIDIMELPRKSVRRDTPIQELTKFDLCRAGYDSVDQETILQNLRQSFQPGKAFATRYQLSDGRQIDIRRRPMPGGGFVSTYTDVTEQVKAQRTAEESRHLLEAVMDAVPAILHVKDRHLCYQMVNQQFLNWWKFKREQVLGRTNQDILAGEMAGRSENPNRPAPLTDKSSRFRDLATLVKRVDERDRQVLQTGQSLPFYEAIYGEFATEPATLLTTKVPLTNVNGEVTHIVTVGLDISKRKKAERERQRWLQLFQDAIESIPNGFAVYDASHRLVICNTAFASLHGVSTESLVGMTALEIFQHYALNRIQTINGQPPSEDPQQALNIYQPSDGIAVELHLKDGHWLLANWHPTAEGGGVYVLTDITHLKQMEQELRDSEQRFRSIAEAHPVPVVIAALSGDRLLYVSPGLASLLGAPIAEIIASSPQRFLVDPVDGRKIKKRLLKWGHVDAYECSLRAIDGREFPVAITARRLHYQDSDAAMGGIIDLTEMKRAEAEIARQREALHQSEKLNALGSLLAGVAHELNNPLSVVVGRTIMLEEMAADPKLREKLRKVRQAAERCARIVKTFLAIARQQPPERSQVQVNELITAAVELVGYGLRTADIEVILDLDPDLPALSADTDQLTQVFTNLLVNAQQALQESPDSRQLRLSTRFDATADAIRIAISDNGPGIPEAMRSRIFEPFYTSKPIGMGTGIGLSFSYGVIQSHGGSIILENPTEGGARFVITLPLNTPAASGENNERAQTADNHPYTILIVDDEPEITEMLAELLSRQGHNIEVAASGNQALEKFAERDYDVILSDLKMPDLDGPGLYRQLQQSHPHLVERLIFITGDTLGMGASEFLAQTGRPIIEKPFVPEQVLRVLHQLIH